MKTIVKIGLVSLLVASVLMGCNNTKPNDTQTTPPKQEDATIRSDRKMSDRGLLPKTRHGSTPMTRLKQQLSFLEPSVWQLMIRIDLGASF
ncbi:hypothetical protein [Paenibacillus sp. FSL K6-2859]|uniref:hypothetical protein n=1 Tax=Paenibacillus sp. FSL K6-2859 TaxID=2921482 RepID=UPI0030F9AEA1